MTAGIRIAAVLVYVGVPLAAAATTAVNVVRAMEISAATEQRAVELAPLEARLARGGRPAGDDLAAVWLPGETKALAAAALQQRIAELIEDVAARVIEVQELGVDEGPDVLMRVTYDASNDALIRSLLGVEAGLPLLDVTALDVAAQRGSEEDAATDDPTLRVGLTVRGYRRSGS